LDHRKALAGTVLASAFLTGASVQSNCIRRRRRFRRTATFNRQRLPTDNRSQVTAVSANINLPFG